MGQLKDRMTKDEALKALDTALWRARAAAVRTSDHHIQIGHAIDAFYQLKEALAQSEPKCIGEAKALWGGPVIHNPPLAQPEQEPVGEVIRLSVGGDVDWFSYVPEVGTLLYTTPPQRKPLFKEFIKWAGAQGYDCAQTCNSDTGEWIVLNPMTADLWKAWQAAHGIKE